MANLISPELGSQQWFAIKFESVRNTAELVPNIVLKVTMNTLNVNKPREIDEIQYGTRDNVYDEYTPKSSVEGEVEGKINIKDIGYFLKGAIGQPTSVQTATTGAYTHTFLPQNLISGSASTQLPSFTAFYPNAKAGIYKSYGCVFDELEIEIGETEAKIKGKIKAIDQVKVTNGTEITNIKAAITYSATIDFKMKFSHLIAKYAATTSGLAASTNFLGLKASLKISIKNNVEFDWSSSAVSGAQQLPFDTIAKQFKASIDTGGLIVRDSTILDFFLADTFQAYEFTLDSQGGGGAVIGTSSLYPLIRVRVSKALLVADIDRPLDDVLAYNLSIPNLVNSATDGWSFQVVVQNNVVSY